MSKPLPTGFFELRPTDDTLEKVSNLAAWSRNDIAGVAVRIYWNAVQPNSATEYDWSYLDGVAALAARYGKRFSICVIGGFEAPAWVYQPGADGDGAAQFRISGATKKGIMPAPWDPNFQRRWSTFLLALAARYDTLSSLSYVIVTGQGWGGQATFCRSQADDAELNAHGGVNVWVNAFVSIVGLYVKAFTQTPLIVNIGAPVYPKELAGFRTASDLCVSSYGSRYGIKNNGLNPKFSTTSWQATDIKTLSPSHPVGFQMLIPSATRDDLVSAIEIGERLGSNLFEVYAADLKLVSNFYAR